MTTAYCYHCGTHHPVEEMKQIKTKGGTKWRCIRSIQAAKSSAAARAAFGRETSAKNREWSSAHIRRVNASR